MLTRDQETQQILDTSARCEEALFHYLDPPDSEVTKRNWLGFYDPQRWRTLTPAQQHLEYLNVHMLCLLHMAERRLLHSPRDENLQKVYALRDLSALTGRRVLDMRQALGPKSLGHGLK